MAKCLAIVIVDEEKEQKERKFSKKRKEKDIKKTETPEKSEKKTLRHRKAKAKEYSPAKAAEVSDDDGVLNEYVEFSEETS